LDVADRKIYVVDAYVDDNKLLEYDYLAYAGTGGASKLGEIQFNTRSIGEYGIALDPNGDMWMAGQMSSNPYDNLISRYIKISNTPNPGVPLSFASKAEPAYLNHPEVPGIVTDITDPAIDVRGAPGELIFIDQDNQAGDFEGVTAHGDFIYAAGGAYGLRSFSVDVAGVLTHIDVDDQGGDYKSVWAGVTGAGPILVFATDSWSFGSGLMTYSVDGSGNLTFLDNDHQGTDGYRGVWGDGTFIYAACKDNGLRSYSVDGAGLLTYIDTDYQAGDDGDYVDVWGDGNFIYVASDLMGLRTYSVDGAGILTHIDTDMQGSGGYMGVWGDGNFIYVATYNQGLRSYSVDGAGNLTYIDTTYQSGLYYSVWGDGTFIYAACRFDGIRSFSVDESGHFTYIDTDKQGSAGYLDVWGDGIFIYAACDFEGLRSYGVTREKGNFASTANIVSDITDPAITVGNFEFLDQDNQGTAAYLDVWGDGNFIYTACHLEGLRSYSVNESGILTHIDSNVAYPGDSYSAVWCDANFIYAATGDYLISYSVDGSGYLTVEDSVTALFTGYKDVCGDGSFIFTANMGTTYGLRSHTVDGAGEITFKNNLQAGAGIGIWCDGNFIYVVGTNGIRSFTVDGNGDLTHKDSDNQGGGVYRSVWGDGNFIYVICDDGVRTYSVDGIGNLTHIVFNLDGAGSGSEKGIWGDGNLIYIGTGSNGIRSFTVDGAGNLTLLDSDDSYGNNYRGVWGDGTFIYACADGLISYKII
jgi:6-phosphogluconolactonase (cycloisomerase 2 family)